MHGLEGHISKSLFSSHIINTTIHLEMASRFHPHYSVGSLTSGTSLPFPYLYCKVIWLWHPAISSLTYTSQSFLFLLVGFPCHGDLYSHPQFSSLTDVIHFLSHSPTPTPLRPHPAFWALILPVLLYPDARGGLRTSGSLQSPYYLKAVWIPILPGSSTSHLEALDTFRAWDRPRNCPAR